MNLESGGAGTVIFEDVPDNSTAVRNKLRIIYRGMK